jgi:amino acid adenylation domain-containing protein
LAIEEMRSDPVAQPDQASAPDHGALSVSQQRQWVLEQLHPCNPAHNVSCGVRLTGPLDAEKFSSAWRDVVQQYEILRTEFHAIDGAPQAVVLASSPPVFSVVGMEGFPPEEREARLSQHAREEVRRPFDLSKCPLLRAFLWRVTSSEYVFLLVAHRIVCDQSSLGILLRQLALRYEAGPNGETVAAVPAPMQYREFVHREGGVSEEDVSYWKQQLTGAPANLDLPLDRPRPPEQTFHGALLPFSISKPLLEPLRNLGKTHGTTLFATLLAAFSVLLSRYSRQDDVVVGTAISGRGDRKLEDLIQQDVVGPIENTIALRIDLSGQPTFSELLARVRAVTAAAFAHQGLPFAALLERLPLERDLSHNPVFQVAFNHRQAPDHTSWAGGISAAAFEVESGTEAFALSLNLIETADSIEGRLSHSTDLFEATTMAGMVEQFRALLAGISTDSADRIFDISLLTEAERSKIMVEFNDTARDFRRDLRMHDFFEAQVERTPESTAVICGTERLTYRELNSRANRVAHYLREQGVGAEVLVGICVERSVEMLVGILGILKAGGAYVPLDPAYPKDRLAAILEDAKAPILLTQQRAVGVLPEHAARAIRLDADWPEISTRSATDPASDVASTNLGYVLFTSGSTGRPKGVALEHRSAAIFIQWAREVFLPLEVAGTLFSTSMCFDLSVFEIFVPLSMGGKVIIAENALALPKLPAADEVTLINTVPSAIAELVRMGGVPASVQVVNLAGEALLTALAQQIYEHTGVRKVYNLYGPTEDTTYSTYTLVPRGGEVTIGRPLPNTQVYILDEDRQLLPIGVPGELYLAGDGLARGYFGREALTNERFVANPFASESGARMYRTGDLARFRADGTLQYLGRIDNQVKVRGFRIELGEIESVLAKHPSVQSAVVIVRQDTPGDKRLVAYVVPSGTSISAGLLKDVTRQRLPEYMVPSAFVQIDAIPLSPNGKINRRLLPVPDSGADGGDVVHPRNELESTLLRIWQTVLGIPNIGIRDNFFDLGGHSLKAARVLVEVERVTGKEIPLSALFRGATVESLAQFISEHADAGDPVAMEIQHGDGSRLPFFAIVPPGEESLGYAMLARHMGPKQTVYKIQGHAPVLDGKRPYSKQEMQDLTDEYVAAMRTVMPDGPYCLGGLCDGTHIAEQIVLRLEAQGEEVGLFAIFDTWVMQHSQIRWLWKVDYYRQRLRQMKGLNLAERLASYRRVAETKIDNMLSKKPLRTDWEETYWPERFIPTQFMAPVVLFKRPKQQFYYINDPQMGWGARSKSGVEIHELDFHHLEILREPHVRRFGETLAEWVERVSRRAGQQLASGGNHQDSRSVSVQPMRQGV